MGLGKNETKPYNYAKYARIYVRADLKKTIIKRKYQKFMEFYADASSLLIALYYVIFIIFNFIDYFYAYHSLSQHIFFFKGIENGKNFNIFHKGKQIQEIISLIDYEGKKNDINKVEIDGEAPRNFQNKELKIKEPRKTNDIFSKKNLKDIQIYESKNILTENKQFNSLKMAIIKEKKIKFKINTFKCI